VSLSTRAARSADHQYLVQTSRQAPSPPGAESYIGIQSFYKNVTGINEVSKNFELKKNTFKELKQQLIC